MFYSPSIPALFRSCKSQAVLTITINEHDVNHSYYALPFPSLHHVTLEKYHQSSILILSPPLWA